MPSGSETMMPVNEITSVTRSPPQSRVSTCGRPNTPPTSRKNATTGKTPKNRIALAALYGSARDQQRHEQDRAQRIGEIDPPLLVFRIEAVHELAELRRDERPAGADRTADRFRQAIGAARPGPYRIDQQESHGRPDQRGEKREADQRQDRVRHAAEQALLQPAGHAGASIARRLQRRDQLVADEGWLCASIAQRSLSRMRALYQFISDARDQRDREIDRHGDGDDLDRLVGLVERGAGEHRDQVGIADRDRERGVLGQVEILVGQRRDDDAQRLRQTTRRSICPRRSPSASAASVCPRGTARMPARTISAMKAAV